MLSILLTVLKMIGITVLVILGLILFILLLILFVPVRYRGNGSYMEDSFAVRLRVSWLWHLLTVRGEYQKDQELHIYLKILGITVYDNLKKNADRKRNKKARSTKTKSGKTCEIQAASSETVMPEAAASTDSWPDPGGIVQEDRESDGDRPTGAEKTVNDVILDELDENCAKKPGIVQKIKNFLINFVNFFKNIKFTFHKVCDTIVRIKDSIDYYLKVLQLDSTKRAFSACRRQLVRVLGKISPRKYRINLHLGFEDPAVMGEVLAVWGMLYPLHQGNIDLQPEFGQSVIEGDFSFQGLVSVFVFVRTACILFFDRDIRQLIKRLKRSEI